MHLLLPEIVLGNVAPEAGWVLNGFLVHFVILLLRAQCRVVIVVDYRLSTPLHFLHSLHMRSASGAKHWAGAFAQSSADCVLQATVSACCETLGTYLCLLGAADLMTSVVQADTFCLLGSHARCSDRHEPSCSTHFCVTTFELPVDNTGVLSPLAQHELAATARPICLVQTNGATCRPRASPVLGRSPVLQRPDCIVANFATSWSNRIEFSCTSVPILKRTTHRACRSGSGEIGLKTLGHVQMTWQQHLLRVVTHLL